jgi:peptidoglycan L-alanyl-D-glutamate endopeptidase CwlK
LLLLAIVAYFLLVCAALGLLLIPGARTLVRHRWLNALSQGQAIMARLRGACRQGLHGMALPSVDAALHLMRWLMAHWLWVGGAVLLLVLAPSGALLLRHFNAFDGYDHTAAHETDPRVATLLAGEQLVPPPALPPDLFLTREVEQAYPMAAHASRQWELLDQEFRQRLLAVFRLMREQHGIEMALVEGYRSPERQAQLAALGPHVTQAGAFASYHQYGLAADCAFFRDGRLVISEQDPWAAQAYVRYGQVASAAGLIWGGNWRSIKDLGHVELRRPGVLRKP